MKHLNKKWLKEKEYISLKKELDDFWEISSMFKWCGLPDTRVSEINRKIYFNFYNKEYGRYHTAPKWYRKMKNRIQRAKSKQTLYKIINIDDNFSFEDNYKDCSYYYFLIIFHKNNKKNNFL